jgi:hypothetical protein
MKNILVLILMFSFFNVVANEKRHKHTKSCTCAYKGIVRKNTHKPQRHKHTKSCTCAYKGKITLS